MRSHVYISGDFNIDPLKINQKHHYNAFYKNLVTAGYLPRITLPTRITDHCATLQDNIFTNVLEEHTSGVIVNSISDHQISLSARILHRAPPPAPSGPKFSNSENCCGSENAMPPKIFWDMEGHRGHFRSKNVFFFKKHILEKIHNKSRYFFKIQICIFQIPML